MYNGFRFVLNAIALKHYYEWLLLTGASLNAGSAPSTDTHTHTVYVYVLCVFVYYNIYYGLWLIFATFPTDYLV